ncbi:MAG: family 43 glycosylhydrolase [bacterium]|nr:family 43 glycosylhydrolase [bacterium]
MPVFNPYLPANEYIPDGEPRVFKDPKTGDDRVYVYGSHDRFGAGIFCMNDYVCWSAPVDNLADWRYEGVIFRKKDDPANVTGLRLLFAPDVVRGTDGRYYLYYAYDFMGVMGVAVSDYPAGPYSYHGHVQYPDGKKWGSRKGDEFPFDPGVLVDDDGRVYLYSGFATKVPFVMSRGHALRNSGGVVMELESDMITIKQGPKLLFPTKENNPPEDFCDHAFFEASSIRKIDGKYVFVYSSNHNHELCWAVSDHPMEGFCFGGTLVDIGDLFLNGNTDESHAVNYLGNTHGGMVEVNGQWYIFYHRQTNQHSYSRQACAEPLMRTADGGFLQAEVTSCGLNGGPLPANGEYEARIACNLWSKEGTARYDKPFPKKLHPYFTQRGKDGAVDAVQYIANMRDGSVAGFKYFDFQDAKRIRMKAGGKFSGIVQVSADKGFGAIAAELPVSSDGAMIHAEATLSLADGVHPLYFRFTGLGAMDFYAFELV